MALKPERHDFQMRLYPQEQSETDCVGEEGFVPKVQTEFGKHAMRGTALTYEGPDHRTYNVETLFRNVVQGKGIALEIGTFRGVSTAVLAHFYNFVHTIDIYNCFEAATLWRYFGVHTKIKPWVIDTDNAKRMLIETLDFDFAFVDGLHTYEAVALDFELTKRCGHVVFHDYGISHCGQVKEFVDTLPKNEIRIEHPFALWKANGHHANNTKRV